MTDLGKLKADNAARWRVAQLTRAGEFYPVAKRLIASKARFQNMEKLTGVPWFVIAVIKERESGADPNFLGSIANGQPWSRVTTIVPKGRGPFTSWEYAAIDALMKCPPYAASWKDWTAGGALTLLEQYNGLGYASGPRDPQGNRYPPQPSPYIWSGTNVYLRGKYVADGVFDPNAIDKQLGCAGILLAMMELDPSIKFDGAVQPAPTPVPPPPDIAPVPTPVPPTNWLASLIAAIVAAFRRK